MSRSMLLALSVGMLALAPLADNLPPQLLPVYGGSGGTAFTLSCGAGKVLTGLRNRSKSTSGGLVGAVGLLCRRVDPNDPKSLGPETPSGTMVGNSAGALESRSCPSQWAVMGARITHDGSVVNAITIVCFSWGSILSKQVVNGAGDVLIPIGGPSQFSGQVSTCGNSGQPANGIRGRASSHVDAIGFICDEP